MNPNNVKDFNATGDGLTADDAAIQQALDLAGHVVIPAGNYRITRTLQIRSKTHLELLPGARLIHCGDTPKKRGDFLLTNGNHAGGDHDIKITGGVFDGNNQGKYNTKDNDNLFNPEAWSGTVLNFFNVKNLVLEDIEIANSVVYYTRFCKIEDFIIKNIRFSSEKPAFNQDGLHFAGFVRHGWVENIRAVTPGQTNDDMLALNADDSLVRLENRDLLCGPIEDIVFRDIFADDCHAAIRMLSVNSPIRNLKFYNLVCGCRNFAINMDGARYCRTPLVTPEGENDYPEGTGLVENIEIDGFYIHSSRAVREKGMICCETRVRNFTVKNLVRNYNIDAMPDKPTLYLGKVKNTTVTANTAGKTIRCELRNRDEYMEINSPVDELFLTQE